MDSPDILKLKSLGGKLAELDLLGALKHADDKLSAVSVLRVQEGAKIHIISQLAGAKIVVASDNLAAQSLAKKLSSYPNVKAAYLPERDDVLIVKKGGSRTPMKRAQALADFCLGQTDTLVISAEALIQWVPSKRLVEQYTLKIEKDGTLPPDEAAFRLAQAGYKRQDAVAEPGDFALRGDILDVFTVCGEAVRISFFDDTIESIKTIDPESMVSLGEVGSAVFAPAGDIIFDSAAVGEAKRNLKAVIDDIARFKGGNNFGRYNTKDNLRSLGNQKTAEAVGVSARKDEDKEVGAAEIENIEAENAAADGNNAKSINFLKTADSKIVAADASNALAAQKTVTDKAREGGSARFEAEESAKYFYATLSEGVQEQAAVWAAPFASGAECCVLEYLADVKPSCVIIDEPKVVWEKLAILNKEFSGRLENLINAGIILPRHKRAAVPPEEIKRQLVVLRKMSFSSLNVSNPVFEPKFVLEPKTRAVPKYYLDPDSIITDLKMFLWNKVRVLMAAGSAERAKAVIKSLAEGGVYAEYSEDGEGEGSVLVTPLCIENGFVYPDNKLCVIGVAECVGKKRAASVSAVKTAFAPPKAGDFVVHRIHGIGRCEGTVIMQSGEFEREFIVLKYQGGDTLYVAADQMDNLQKYVGEENPRLNRIGGKEFEREKDKVRKSVRKLAVNLLELYAKREKQRGYKYSPDTVWQKEFEDNFEYEETADQLKAIEDIKSDMESGKIMDRLLVGDVGFGKTEVAFRAMFKAALDNKQSALLAPTTILARQHFELLSKRLEPFGIKCALLTRLQTEAENKRVLQALADGTLHMVVATHKLLAANVKFNDLGLLVLDEEQRFGVEHKEKLKEKYPIVDVLTLSATPIPRTLNMALSGVRDISLLETPPKGRLPVQTYVAEYSDALCVDAVARETARGGQTLILLNDIGAHEPFAAKLRAAVDNGVRVITAHGQMAAGELEKRIAAFYEKQYDVLISTTIIENGIDLPDANTLIVIDSERFGLAQLYQLRGRVGRRGALAHAYFTLPPSGGLTQNAEKRLKALLENTEIGSGFRVAMSDLSIRGAGSLLGAEQSGHIDHVGYEMYLELLDQAVDELKTGKPHAEERDVDIKIDAAAYIRDGYVGGRDKLRVYKKISSVSSLASRDALLKELDEVYGKVELPLENLVNIALIKNLAKRYGVSRVIINKNGAAFNFYGAEVFKNEALMRAVSARSREVVLTSAIPPALIFDAAKLSAEQKIGKVLAFLVSAETA